MLATILLNRACMPFGDGVIAGGIHCLAHSMVPRLRAHWVWPRASACGQGTASAPGMSSAPLGPTAGRLAMRWALASLPQRCVFLCAPAFTVVLVAGGRPARYGAFMYARAAAAIAHAGVCHRLQYADAVHRSGVVCLAAGRQPAGAFLCAADLPAAGLWGPCAAFCWPRCRQTPLTFLFAVILTFLVVRRYRRMARQKQKKP